MRRAPAAPAAAPLLLPPQENGLLYGAAAVAGLLGLAGIVAVERTLRLSDLLALGIGLSNTFALGAGLLLMGYGLVEIPREAWRARPEQLLQWSAHRRARVSARLPAPVRVPATRARPCARARAHAAAAPAAPATAARRRPSRRTRRTGRFARDVLRATAELDAVVTIMSPTSGRWGAATRCGRSWRSSRTAAEATRP